MGKGQSEGKVLAQMTKRSVSLEVGGKTYKLAPLELKQLSEIDQWASLQPFERLKQRFKVMDFTEEQQQKMLDKRPGDRQSARHDESGAVVIFNSSSGYDR